MEVKGLTQNVKKLRAGKGLSQQELAKKAGLSLRTVQRVENGETKPTGETLKRIANALEISPEELLNWIGEKDSFKKSIKTKYGYLHIFESKLIFSKSQDFNTAVSDYEKSINNFFKTLTVFLITVPVFAIIATTLYKTQPHLSFYAGSMAIFFMLMGIYTMLFTSAKPIIYRSQIKNVQLQNSLFQNIIVIKHYNSGRIQRMSIIISKNEMDTAKEVFLTEKLSNDTDFKLKKKKQVFDSVIKFIFFFMIIYAANFFQSPFIKRTWIYGLIFLVLNGSILFLIIKGFMESYKWKKQLKKNKV